MKTTKSCQNYYFHQKLFKTTFFLLSQYTTVKSFSSLHNNKYKHKQINNKSSNKEITLKMEPGSSSTFNTQSYLLGAIIGDIVGSRFELNGGNKTTNFELITPKCTYTDDTILTIAVADALINNADYTTTIQKWGKTYPNAGYGKSFILWLHSDNPSPYNSWGNGSAMRVSACGYLPTLNDVLEASKASAECTHNHPEGVKGAQAVAVCIFLARNGKTKEEIKEYISDSFGYDLNRSLDSIRPNYNFDVSCQGSVPESIIAFLEGNDYESTIRLAISLGGDTDTQAAIAGSIAQAFYKEIDPELVTLAREKLNEELLQVVDTFNDKILQS